MEENQNPAIQEPQNNNIWEDITKDSKCSSNGQKHCHRGVACLNIVLLVGLILLYVFHFTGIGSKTQKSQVKYSTSDSTSQTTAPRIAYVNTDTLMAKYEYARDLEKQLQDFQTAKRNSYVNQMQQFEKDYNGYIHGGADNMTLTQQQNKEKELQDRAQRLQSLEGEMAQQIQEKTLAESEKMTNAVYNFIREYNESHQQFDLILARSFSNSPILYGEPGLDITNDIVEGLNEEYAKVKSKKK